MNILKNIPAWFGGVKKYATAHKFMSAIFIMVVVGGGWYVYTRATATSTQTRYLLGTVERGTVVSSVTASGQIAASRKLDVKAEVSGKITYVAVKPGQIIAQGALIASIDATEAQKTLRDAQTNLESAKLNLEKLQKPPTTLSLTQAQNAVSTAEDSLARVYIDSENDVVGTFLDLPEVMTSLQSILTDTNVNHGSQWNIDYYRDTALQYDDKARIYRDDAYTTYLAAKTAYDATLADYKKIGAAPDKATLEQITIETYDMLRSIAASLKSINAFIQFYEDTLRAQNRTPATAADTALTNLSTYISKITTHLTALTSDTTSIKSGKQSIEEKKQSLADLVAGADTLDIRSSQLTIKQREDAVADAEATLAKYYVRAPFAGMVAATNVFPGDDAGGAVLATLITPQQIATLSLNEVDAAKIKLGDKVTLTFDAIDGLTLTGSVAQVDAIGTVSQGVVSYAIQVAFDTQDSRIKPGMTVNAAIQTATHQDVLIVPTSAVKTQNGVSYVQVFDTPIPVSGATGGSSTGSSQGVISTIAPSQIEVQTGISDDQNVEIISGLTEGQQIVVRTISGTAALASTQSAPSLFGGGVRTTGGTQIRRQ